METVDILELYKLLIDFTVKAEIQHGTRRDVLPITESGDVYFYPQVERMNS